MGDAQWQFAEPASLQHRLRRVAYLELAVGLLDGNLDDGGGTDEDGVGTRADEPAGAGRKRRIVSEPPEKRVSVQKQTQESLPGFEFGLGHWLEEFGADLEFSFHASRFALPLFLTKRLKANERLIAASDDDLFAIAGLFDEAREVGLGVMDFDRGHIS